ncbi:MAG: patatin-like phospholipase family protein, partial [Thermoanaerobaculaceae bacterium]|nr:patatin-like phospholipase family protein [Thermoanaerobaculaceae bacterium]
VLALGGGGMRGVAHLGVLAALEEAGVKVAGIAGTSSGALLGALWIVAGAEGAIARVREYVASGRARAMTDIAGEYEGRGLGVLLRRIGHWVALARLLTRRTLLTHEEFLAHVAFFLPDWQIADLATPLVAVATDTESGDEVRLGSGSLRLAVAASSAMPGLAPPVPWQGRRLQDGGAVAEIPVGAARTLGSPVLAVEVSEGLPPARPDRDRIPRAMFRAAAMGWRALRQRLLAEADAVLAPAVNHLHWADYHSVDEAVAAGRAAARDFLQCCR